MVSAEHLHKELFTHSGAGTMILRGHKLTYDEDLSNVDRDRLRILLQSEDSAFQDGSLSVASYYHSLENFKNDGGKYQVYVDEPYQAVAIVKESPDSNELPVLDKLVSTKSAPAQQYY